MSKFEGFITVTESVSALGANIPNSAYQAQLFLCTIFFFVALEPFENGVLALVAFRKLASSRPGLREELRFRLGKHWKCSAIAKFH